MLYNVIFVSAIHQHESATGVHMFLFKKQSKLSRRKERMRAEINEIENQTLVVWKDKFTKPPGSTIRGKRKKIHSMRRKGVHYRVCSHTIIGDVRNNSFHVSSTAYMDNLLKRLRLLESSRTDNLNNPDLLKQFAL